MLDEDKGHAAAGRQSFHKLSASVEAARSAARTAHLETILCGEEKCLPPAGFHLGNSPRGFKSDAHANRVVFMSTTNGTRAILAARTASHLFAGALVNATGVARAIASEKLDVTLLCAGTDGQIALEDVLGAGAVIAELREYAEVTLASDRALLAESIFAAGRRDLRDLLRRSRGGPRLACVHPGRASGGDQTSHRSPARVLAPPLSAG